MTSNANLLCSNMLFRVTPNNITGTYYNAGCLSFWSLRLRDEQKLRGFEESVLRKIFGPKRDEVTWERRRLHDDDLHDLYSSPYNVRVIK